ncbi:hypothetical protein A2641_03870 [Candidatus Nomurabacteria bacterium RIFCSPHIGHO2_01_FULL_37_25]|uniref:Purple acid phosphatase N-terminal domain-containing protein n=1 Tax=Candidatus Nomurabacteria bacterium RIFCSPLOWO2_01_FULL_36_16 TaxID=1801767 RepID=A0A1F6WYG9_9BACT|nr:MAG: hypothetical protein A2641_03870 [Candidatus Nomurabacteria bacterium RIFCSPHIGHO2_01_FULL_37_25]OGI75169.1 MAG: hypothetical protein A3D36_01025 [Candidatus Nomurabacteria bacterium RIFCSPHIGHO2_02_FULL_36_29]OGI86824.1 MAG: hypothetical protein A3A91_01235 [Candidatus Nomurabacteria bacterium RIFCSPLOWO2_01_FULL_36_16]OGI95301.1 MAG: hypothetical protein A3I84_01795 [Candidatus Nomurabacteria bacterium RIFCSPLOWO2_02_FULL_36_8]
MKTLIQKFIFSVLTIITLFGFTSNVFAAPLQVTFVPDPLFNKPNFLPSDETNGEITVTNNSGASQTILTEAINVTDNDNFGSLLHLEIAGTSGILFDDTLANFLSTAGEVSLGAITNGESKVFTYTISFVDSSDNSYQGKTLGFDVCVGFSGGTKHCGDTVVGDENDTDGGPSTGGGPSNGGGSGGGPIVLTIFNEKTVDITEVGGFPATATATITWDTNVLSTSQVVYGPTPPLYTLDMNALYFGYPSGTIEDPTKVLHHSVLITGLTPGQTYVYRVVSRASPPTISFEKYFAVPLLATNNPNNPNIDGGNSSVNTDDSSTDRSDSEGFSSPTSSEFSDTNSEGDASQIEDDNLDLDNNLVANVLLSGFDNLVSICTLIGILILLALYMIWHLWIRKKYEESRMPEKEIWNRFYLFFVGSSFLVMILASLIQEYCILPVLLIAFVISLLIYCLKKFKE